MISYFILALGLVIISHPIFNISAHFLSGIFKPNIAPTVLDQYTRQREFTKTLRSGEKVLVDPETTIQRMMLIFYGLINVGAFFALATTYSEKYVGHWLAFLLPGFSFSCFLSCFTSGTTRPSRRPPAGAHTISSIPLSGLH